MTIQDELQLLSEAHGPAELAAAMRRLQGKILRERAKAGQEGGTLAETITEAMRIWDAQKAEGIAKADRVAGLARTLQAAWPKGRVESWQYRCATCHDYGLHMRDCPGDATCGRSQSHLPHEFGTACLCPYGLRFKDKPRSPDDFTAAGKAKPRKSGWARVGR